MTIAPTSTEMETARAMSSHILRSRRSNRSANAPPGRMRNSHGSRWATTTPQSAAGRQVTDVASSGIATRRSPSPRFDNAVAAHSDRKLRGNGVPRRRPARGGASSTVGAVSTSRVPVLCCCATSGTSIPSAASARSSSSRDASGIQAIVLHRPSRTLIRGATFRSGGSHVMVPETNQPLAKLHVRR